mmetsp:Transcript_44519/g.110312  ORF Transcript_44519/g.110312 Transcript_44519/m.110312 type:complete len:268 (+) Transcript_44519:1203-2006(+)
MRARATSAAPLRARGASFRSISPLAARSRRAAAAALQVAVPLIASTWSPAHSPARAAIDPGKTFSTRSLEPGPACSCSAKRRPMGSPSLLRSRMCSARPDAIGLPRMTGRALAAAPACMAAECDCERGLSRISRVPSASRRDCAVLSAFTCESPLTEAMRSPGRMPAFAASEPGKTSSTSGGSPSKSRFSKRMPSESSRDLVSRRALVDMAGPGRARSGGLPRALGSGGRLLKENEGGGLSEAARGPGEGCGCLGLSEHALQVLRLC